MVARQVTIARLSAGQVQEAGRVLGTAFASSPLERAVRRTIDERQRRGGRRGLHGDVSPAGSECASPSVRSGWSV